MKRSTGLSFLIASGIFAWAGITATTDWGAALSFAAAVLVGIEASRRLSKGL